MSFRRVRGPSSTASRWQCLRRWFGLDHNPLRRRTDRVQTRLRLAAFAVAMLGLVGTGVAAYGTYANGTRLQRADATAEYRTTGRVLSATHPVVSPDGTILQSMIRVSFRDRAGRTHVQLLVAPGGTPPATRTVKLWVDARGKATASRPSTGSPRMAAVMTGGLGAGLVLTGTVLLYLLAMLPVERRRLAAWQSEWSVVEPGWRRQVL